MAAPLVSPQNGLEAIARHVGAARTTVGAFAGTSVNVGTFHGGTRGNVIAGTAHGDIDVRVTSQAEAERVEHYISVAVPSDSRVKIAWDGGWNRPVMARTAESLALYETAVAVAARLGWELDHTAVGGGSDGNFLSALGRPVLDGLGAVRAGAHARQEHVLVADMPTRTALLSGLLAALVRRSIHHDPLAAVQ